MLDRWHGQDPEANDRLLDSLAVDTAGMTEEQKFNLGRRLTQANNQGIRPTPNYDEIEQTIIPDRLDGGYLALDTDPNTGQVRTIKIGRDGERVGYTLGTDRYDEGRDRYENWDVFYDWETDSLKRAANVQSDNPSTTVTETENAWWLRGPEPPDGLTIVAPADGGPEPEPAAADNINDALKSNDWSALSDLAASQPDRVLTFADGTTTTLSAVRNPGPGRQGTLRQRNCGPGHLPGK